MAEEGRKRVGIMGGTFDPIHIVHLMLGECAYDQFHLDYVLFMPSGNPPHKTKRMGGATDEQRLRMTELAIRNNPHFRLDAKEMERGGYTYTHETLQIMKQQHPDTDYFFIIGADSLMAFDTWKEPELICQNCTLLAAVRNHLEIAEMRAKAAQLKTEYDAEISLLYTPDIDISSSMVRQWLQERRSLRYFLPDPVLDYIAEHHIYERIPGNEATS
jgi:nicotinate-nucleotide adenylyltransferase